MPATRGRGLSEMGQAFTPLVVSGGTPAAVAQPIMVRMQGIPTMPGYRDRIGKWNALILPLVVYEALKHLIEYLRL